MTIARKTFLLALLLSGATLPSLVSCRPQADRYTVGRYFSAQEQDTLLVNLVTFIGRRPRWADHATRHLPEHRSFYIQQAQDFRIHRFHIAPDSTHYFYMIRPARSPRGNRRGVGGTFRMGANLRPLDLVEHFNTPVLPEAELDSIGEILFHELIASGHVDKYRGRRDLIEWPDGRLWYDRTRNEWRYYDLSQ